VSSGEGATTLQATTFQLAVIAPVRSMPAPERYFFAFLACRFSFSVF
jgi:hypothetical protein